ncbi:MAG: ATP-binding protein [Gammaproteobacteria bacterium]|nr:ATP-binding protein [Gammaproteobacteria bacterium]
MEPKKLKMRPYARLLTMLGDQLIKNEKIALVELIKNSYDADANWVEVRFEDFNEDMTYRENSRILVRDDGSGMTLDTIQRHWMNPAAPKKLIEKQEGKNKTPKKKRIKQGEKGIGRFTILKLGLKSESRLVPKEKTVRPLSCTISPGLMKTS